MGSISPFTLKCLYFWKRWVSASIWAIKHHCRAGHDSEIEHSHDHNRHKFLNPIQKNHVNYKVRYGPAWFFFPFKPDFQAVRILWNSQRWTICSLHAVTPKHTQSRVWWCTLPRGIDEQRQDAAELPGWEHTRLFNHQLCFEVPSRFFIISKLRRRPSGTFRTLEGPRDASHRLLLLQLNCLSGTIHSGVLFVWFNFRFFCLERRTKSKRRLS